MRLCTGTAPPREPIHPSTPLWTIKRRQSTVMIHLAYTPNPICHVVGRHALSEKSLSPPSVEPVDGGKTHKWQKTSRSGGKAMAFQPATPGLTPQPTCTTNPPYPNQQLNSIPHSPTNPSSMRATTVVTATRTPTPSRVHASHAPPLRATIAWTGRVAGWLDKSTHGTRSPCNEVQGLVHNASTLPTRLVAVAVASAVAVAGELRGEEVNRSLDRSAGVESSEWESGGGTWRWSCPGRRGNQDEHFKCDCKPRNHVSRSFRLSLPLRFPSMSTSSPSSSGYRVVEWLSDKHQRISKQLGPGNWGLGTTGSAQRPEEKE
ncbi:hypothetical protein IAQ61_001013, partial [Plenodomus lingam]|uniref:Predicted protein n=1 Tax=Leptosphaeria maculans (strain JN3 / isolate v23.1.3 / race Av1-4-5-6-7-8) TaxID=985895 RepID=E5A2J6_LEPMJ